MVGERITNLCMHCMTGMNDGLSVCRVLNKAGLPCGTNICKPCIDKQMCDHHKYA